MQNSKLNNGRLAGQRGTPVYAAQNQHTPILIVIK